MPGGSATAEVARAALAHYYDHRPRKPVVAVIYTHSHIDHFGGVRGVIDEADVKAGKVAVIAPAGFMEAVSGENVLAGMPMARRAATPAGTRTVPMRRRRANSAWATGRRCTCISTRKAASK